MRVWMKGGLMRELFVKDGSHLASSGLTLASIVIFTKSEGSYQSKHLYTSLWDFENEACRRHMQGSLGGWYIPGGLRPHL